MKENQERQHAYKFATRIYISHLFLDLIRKVNIINPVDEEIKVLTDFEKSHDLESLPRPSHFLIGG